MPSEETKKTHHMKKLTAILLTNAIVSSFSLFSMTPDWSLKSPESGWNSQTLIQMYFHNSELQRQWSWELISRAIPKSDEKILDFGSGDGKISAELSRIVSQGKIDGCDISADMVHFASIKFPKSSFPNLSFYQSHSLTFSDRIGKNEYDRIYSFCVLHLVENPIHVLINLKSHLKKGGMLCCLIPAGKNPEFFQAASEAFQKYQLESPWNNSASKQQINMRTVDGCYKALEESGFSPILVEMIDRDTAFYSKEELIAWMIGTTTANWNIPLSQSREFFTYIVERMKELDPYLVDHEGRWHMKLSRIHLLAQSRE